MIAANVPVGGIYPYDGYTGEKFWKGLPDGATTYYDPALDNQVRVPLRPLEEIRADLYARACSSANAVK